MSSAASIKAGEAWVGIHGRMGNLPETLAKAQRQVSNWAGSVEQIGEQVGSKFGKTIMGGLVGFAAVGAADNALRSIADKMREALASGSSLEFSDIGIAVGESIAEGLKSVPIAGALGDIFAMSFFDEALGSPMQTEAALARVQKQRDDQQKAWAELGKLNEEITKAMAGDGAVARVTELNDRVSEVYTSLVKAGVGAKQAGDAIRDFVSGYQQVLSEDADAKIATLLDGFARISGELTAADMEARQLSESLREIEVLLTAAGKSKEEIASVIEAIRGEAEFSKIQQDANDRQKKIDDLIKSIEDENASFGKSQAQLLEERLKALGATQEELDRALNAALDIEDKRKAADEASKRASTKTVESTVGSFLSGAFQTTSADTAVVDSSKETARNTRRMVTLLERGSLSYQA
mgnify:CR=1 FL=1